MVHTSNGNKVILFCGPAASGKTVAVAHLKKSIPLVSRQCKDHLHKLTRLFFNVPEDRYWEIYSDRVLKGTPLEEFSICISQEDYETLYSQELFKILERVEVDTGEAYLTIREAMIYISEVIMKPRFGDDYFGRVRANNIPDNEVSIDDSCGFIEELPPLIEKVGSENILLMRIHREGYTFEGDSRSYIPEGVVDNTIDICNNTSLENFLEEVQFQASRFLI